MLSVWIFAEMRKDYHLHPNDPIQVYTYKKFFLKLLAIIGKISLMYLVQVCWSFYQKYLFWLLQASQSILITFRSFKI